MKMKAKGNWGTVARNLESAWGVSGDAGGQEWCEPQVKVEFYGGARISELNRMVGLELRRAEKCDAIGISWMNHDACNKEGIKVLPIAELGHILPELRQVCERLREFPYSFAVVGADSDAKQCVPAYDTWATACRNVFSEHGVTVVDGSSCWRQIDFADP